MGISLFILRRRRGGAKPPFAVPLYPLLPAIFCLTSAYLLYASLAYAGLGRSEEHTSELQSLMRISYAVFCLKKKNIKQNKTTRLNSITTHLLHTHTQLTLPK